MKRLGFAPFMECGNPLESWENKILANGGIRVEIVDDVASVWCPAQGYKNAAMPTDEVIPTIVRLMGGKEQVDKVLALAS